MNVPVVSFYFVVQRKKYGTRYCNSYNEKQMLPIPITIFLTLLAWVFAMSKFGSYVLKGLGSHESRGFVWKEIENDSLPVEHLCSAQFSAQGLLSEGFRFCGSFQYKWAPVDNQFHCYLSNDRLVVAQVYKKSITLETLFKDGTVLNTSSDKRVMDLQNLPADFPLNLSAVGSTDIQVLCQSHKAEAKRLAVDRGTQPVNIEIPMLREFTKYTLTLIKWIVFLEGKGGRPAPERFHLPIEDPDIPDFSRQAKPACRSSVLPFP